MTIRPLANTALWLALGGLAGALLPEPISEPLERARPATAAPSREPGAADRATDVPPPAGAVVEGFADPCLGVRAVEGRVDELAAEVGRARAAFEHRFGARMPPPPGFDPDEAERRWAEVLEGYPDRVWSTVDCAVYPCVGLVLTDRPLLHQATVQLARDLVGQPALVLPETHLVDGRATDLVTIGFTGELVEDLAQRRWVHSVATRAKELHAPAIAAAKDTLRSGADE